MSTKELLTKLREAIEQGPSKISDDERKDLLAACEQLRTSYETPFETTLRIMFSGHQAIAIRLGVDMKLFDAAAKQPQDNVTIKQLADDTGADPLLISRNWFTFFPVEKKFGDTKPSDVLLVDVGGSQGGDLRAFQTTFPAIPGRLILQDLPIVVQDAKDIPDGIEVQGYDFFKEQPVKGAKAYYLRTVLHDWPDKQALEILRNVREAMSKDSLLLINETIIPETNASVSSATADLTMMVSFASLERTRKQFENLFNEAQLDLVQVWHPENFGGAADIAEQASLLEVRLRQ
ncbi:sterigmatocystin 8-o-methyltransferase precursor [Trichoderma arundinaceum]|uniref:Sterigmatocystin 8-o-methyltransferase n=1 Tax=Trichoderma arundinaceum TaxID=490622 RepID=A0A395NS52_TRIAR|nr:sterigmatocystin 8-o-methyltransferase precursor [Trichoderma arundinaceum]